MDAAAGVFPARYVISRSLRVPHFIRAFGMTAVGALLLLVAEVLQLESWKTVIWVIGIVLAFSGGFAVIGVGFATLFHKTHVIEVNTQGLEVTYEDGKRQLLFWDDVVSYEVKSRGAVGMGDMSDTGDSYSIIGAVIGCLLGLSINAYFVALGQLIAGQIYDVRFNLAEKQFLSVKGFGQPMDELIQKVLPQFLADKKM